MLKIKHFTFLHKLNRFAKILVTIYRISGNPVLFDWSGLQLAGFTLPWNGQRQLALAVVIRDLRLDHVLAKLFNKKIARSVWMSSMNAGIKLLK